MADKKINSLKDLQQLSETLQAKQKDYKLKVLICMTGCRALGAKDISTAQGLTMLGAGLVVALTGGSAIYHGEGRSMGAGVVG